MKKILFLSLTIVILITSVVLAKETIIYNFDSDDEGFTRTLDGIKHHIVVESNRLSFTCDATSPDKEIFGRTIPEITSKEDFEITAKVAIIDPANGNWHLPYGVMTPLFLNNDSSGQTRTNDKPSFIVRTYANHDWRGGVSRHLDIDIFYHDGASYTRICDVPTFTSYPVIGYVKMNWDSETKQIYTEVNPNSDFSGTPWCSSMSNIDDDFNLGFIGGYCHDYDFRTPHSGWDRIATGYTDDISIMTKVVIPACVNIDPDTLNLKSKGKWITAYIELPEDYNAADIDASTVLLNVNGEGVPAVIDEEYGFVKSEESYLTDQACKEGILERMVKFDGEAVQNILEVGDVELTIIGELIDGTQFEGSDTIKVIEKGRGK